MERLTKMSSDNPVDRALCVFQTYLGDFFIGHLDWSLDMIIEHNTHNRRSIQEVYKYQYILNEKGGFIWVNRPVSLNSIKVWVS